MSEQKKVLIVDDEQDLVDVFSVRIEVNGFDVVTASDGQEALEKIKNEKPDLILLDLMLPKVNGYEVCRMTKFDDNTRDIKVIVLSALNEPKDREKALEAGADAVFIKPFDLDLLVTKIRDLLK